LWRFESKVDEETIRAYSMANYPGEKESSCLTCVLPPRLPVRPRIRLRVKCLPISSILKPGDEVTISGPYGEFFIADTEAEMIYIGGGAGMAPLRSHIYELYKERKTSRKVSYWYGARSMREMFYEDEFRAIEKDFPNFKMHIALSDPMPEDNWTGLQGFIHQVLLK